jgi:hypothetical protein
MIEWLLAPVDASRAHDIGLALSWHGRLMTLGWGVLVPLGILMARYFKVTPRQDWPRELDNKFWWHWHLSCQYAGGACMLAGLLIILIATSDAPSAWLHRALGYAVLAFGALQYVAGWLRGTKGGPNEPNLRGDHYDMTARRVAFERIHKSVGYLALVLGVLTIGTGLWAANAPRWMWLALAAWWIMLAATAVRLERKDRYVSSYHAIWGADPVHPGNRR